MSAQEMQLVEYFLHPAVQAHHFDPARFWEPLSDSNPFGRLRVNACDLETLLTSIIQTQAGGGPSAPH